jgi:diacylglycerol kinase family enzyme
MLGMGKFLDDLDARFLTPGPSRYSLGTMSGIGVVLNPRSRRNLRDPAAVRRLARTLGDFGVVREVRSKDELYRTAEDFKRLKIDVLGISGGDGTNHVTITGFIDVYGGSALPQLAFLRGGTMNTVANSVGVGRGKPEGLLGRVMRAYAARATKPLANVERYVMRIGEDYGFLFGTGAVYGYLAEYYAGGEPSPLVAAKTLLRGVGSTLVGGEMVRRLARPFRGSVELDDGTKWPERDYLSVAGGTIDQIGLGFRPFRRYAERDGAFHLLGIYASPFQFVRDLPRIWNAEPMRDNRTFEALPKRAIVRSAEGKVRYMVDGDLHEAPGSELVVSMGPRVKIVVGT